MDTPLGPSLQDLRRLYERRETSPIEVISGCLQAETEQRDRLNAFVTATPDLATTAAEAAEKAFRDGAERGPFAGIPIAVKDLIDVRGVRTTYGSAIFADHRPASDAHVVGTLAGAALVGKTSTHEFAWGITSENPHYGPCRNPWDPDRIAGGSSGGSAVAVSAGQAILALGTDTAGSVRIPAAYCGVIGFKPTFGLVPVDGIFPLAPSLDHAGVFARHAEDAALVLEAWLDGAGVAAPPRPGQFARPLRIGLLEQAGAPPASPAIAARLEAAASTFAGLGAEVATLRFDPPADPLAALGRVQGTEALDSHASRGLFPARAREYGPDVRERLERASELTLQDFLDGLRARREISAAVARLFTKVDFLLSLVSPCPPPRIGETEGLRDLVLPYTVLQNLGGFPACAFPVGTDDQGLPVGAQLTGPRFSDFGVLGAVGAVMARLPAVPLSSP